MATAPKYPGVKVQLTGQDGNTYVILGACTRAAREQGLTKDQIIEFVGEAINGDYDHVLQTCQSYFRVS